MPCTLTKGIAKRSINFETDPCNKVFDDNDVYILQQFELLLLHTDIQTEPDDEHDSYRIKTKCMTLFPV